MSVKFAFWRAYRIGFRRWRWEVKTGSAETPTQADRQARSGLGIVVAKGFAKSERAAKEAALAAYDEVQL